MNTTSYVTRLLVNTEKPLPVRITTEFYGSRPTGWPRTLKNVYLRRGLSLVKVSVEPIVVTSSQELHSTLVLILQGFVICHKFINTSGLNRFAFTLNARLSALCSLHRKISNELSLTDLLNSLQARNALENLYMFHCGRTFKIRYSQRYKDFVTSLIMKELDCMEFLAKVCAINSIPLERGAKAVLVKKSPLITYPSTLKFLST